MTMAKGLAGMAMVLSLAGCAQATGYWQQSLLFADDGYKEREQAPGLWRVSYSANAYTTRETIQTYWLYRCSELTLAKGYDGFEITSRTNLSFDGAPAEPIRLAASGPVMIYMPAPSAVSMPYHFGGDIRMLRAPLATQPGKVFDALALKKRLEPMITGQKCDEGNICPHEHDYLRP